VYRKGEGENLTLETGGLEAEYHPPGGLGVGIRTALGSDARDWTLGGVAISRSGCWASSSTNTGWTGGTGRRVDRLSELVLAVVNEGMKVSWDRDCDCDCESDRSLETSREECRSRSLVVEVEIDGECENRDLGLTAGAIGPRRGLPSSSPLSSNELSTSGSSGNSGISLDLDLECANALLHPEVFRLRLESPTDLESVAVSSSIHGGSILSSRSSSTCS
jgi:hypothetical protein